MGFHEVLFPTDISYGSSGGPGFNSAIVQTDAGITHVTQRRTNPVREWQVGHNLKTKTQSGVLLSFYFARGGAANAFRFEDWLDFTSAADGQSDPTNVDQIIAQGDGTTKIFQLTKTYSDGTYTYTRTIRKPKAGTVLISLGGVAQTDPTHYSFDPTTGLVTFVTAPGNGVAIGAGFEFDVPARFAPETDQQFDGTTGNFDGTDFVVSIIEDIDTNLTNNEMGFHGGGLPEVDMVGDTRLSFANGRFQAFKPDANGYKLWLPDAASLPDGAPVLIIANTSTSFSFDIYNWDGSTFLFGPLGSSSVKQVGKFQSAGGITSLIFF